MVDETDGDPVNAQRLLSVVLRDAEMLADRMERVVEPWQSLSHDGRAALGEVHPGLVAALIKAEYYLAHRQS